jgi:hypothetical protein
VIVYRLRKFSGRVGQIGKPLPTPFKTFGDNRVTFRHGATSMIAGAPGSFKSVLALNMAAYWANHGLTGMYFSADSDEMTVSRRISGILTGDPIERIEAAMIKGDRAPYIKSLSCMDDIQFEYEQLDMDGITTRLQSHEAVYGAFPDVIWIDNLIDFVDAPDDWGGMLQMIKDLDALSREIKAHICILHHAKLRGGGDNRKKPDPSEADRPPADWEIQGRVTQIPRLVLSVKESGMCLNVACIKNTNGPMQRDGSKYMEFQVKQSMQVEESTYGGYR